MMHRLLLLQLLATHQVGQLLADMTPFYWHCCTDRNKVCGQQPANESQLAFVLTCTVAK